MTERNCIAVGVTAGGKLWKGHFGMAPEYAIYDESGAHIETRPNPYGAGPGAESHHDNPGLIVDLLPECGVFIAWQMGDQSRQNLAMKRGITPVITTHVTPQEALQAYLGSVGAAE